MLDPLIAFPSNLANALLTRSTAFVIIVEPGNTARMMIMDVLRSLGFEKLKGASNLREALHYLETERVDWLITPLLFDRPLNALQVLNLITEQPVLKGVAVSLLVDHDRESEMSVLCQAFTLGLLSWHARSYAREDMHTTLEHLLRLMAKHEGRVAFVAGDYIRRFLIKQKLYRSLVALEEELLQLHPGSALQMLALAEAELLSGRLERGGVLLSQVVALDDSLETLCEEMKTQFHTPNGPALVGTIRNVVVIEPDSVVMEALCGLLQKIGVPDPKTFTDGHRAFEWIAGHTAIDLILMAWDLPGMNGAVLIQRLRKVLKLKTIVLIVAPPLKAEEKPLLKEMGVDDVFEKPLDTAHFLQRLSGILQLKQYNTKRSTAEMKVRRLLAARRTTEAMNQLDVVLKDKRVSDSIKKELEASVEFQTHNYAKALALAIDALKLSKGGHQLGLLNLAGQAFLKLGQLESAVKCLERAKQLSPLNFERLFALAECYLALGQTEAADREVREVLRLDPLNAMAIEIQAKVDLELGRKMDPRLGLPSAAFKRIAIACNNRGVALLNAGRNSEARLLYERTLNLLPEEEGQGVIPYNLALAYAFEGEIDAAAETLTLLEGMKAASLVRKKNILQKRLETLLHKGLTEWPKDWQGDRDLVPELDERGFEAPRSSRKANVAQWDEVLSHETVHKGDIGCYRLFQYLDLDKSQHFEKLGESIHYQRR